MDLTNPVPSSYAPSEIRHAIHDIFTSNASSPIPSSLPGTSAYPPPDQPQSALVFHPSQYPQQQQRDETIPPAISTASSLVFPNNEGSSSGTSRVPLSPLMGIGTQRTYSDRSQRSEGDNPEVKKERKVKIPIGPGSTGGGLGFKGFRRGSVMTPEDGSGKGREVLTLDLGVVGEGVGIGQGARSGQGRKKMGDRSKEDVAMAKWRQWVVEQPAIPHPNDTSPIRSLQTSPLSTSIPMVPLSTTTSPSPNSLRPTSTSTSTFSPISVPMPTLPRLPINESNPSSTSSTTPRHHFQSGTEIYNTETMQALRDVELAVDEDIAGVRSGGGRGNRRMSTNPRVSERENPFMEITTRLGSRRVRPIVLELMLALGHWVDVLCSAEGKGCPWSGSGLGLGGGESGEEGKWLSRVISAIQEGKKRGFLGEKVDKRDVEFWRGEVKFGLIDAEGAFGCVKGLGRGFGKALKLGEYGEVEDGNVLGKEREGGNMVRLLNDLEEAVWGDAPPRTTDLSWELPIDFDPYAPPDPSDLQTSNTHRHSSTTSNHLPKPQTTQTSPPTPRRGDSDPLTPPSMGTVLARGRRPTVIGHGGGDALDLSAFVSGNAEGEGLSLEEIGKRRHREWVERNKREGMMV